MFRFARPPRLQPEGDTLQVRTLSWHVVDHCGRAWAIALGVDDQGRSICIRHQEVYPELLVAADPNSEDTIPTELARMFNEDQYKVELCRGQNFDCFTNNDKPRYLKITFKSIADHRKFKYSLKDFEIYNDRATPLQQYLARLDLTPVSTIEVTISKHGLPGGWRTASGWSSRCSIDVRADSLCVIPDPPGPPPAVVACYDIEAFSKDGSFPSPTVTENIITCICIEQYRMNDPSQKEMVAFVWSKCDPIEDCILIPATSEKELLQNFYDWLQKVQPDIMAGHNIFGFDIGYLAERCKMHGLSLGSWGKLLVPPSEKLVTQRVNKIGNMNTFVTSPGLNHADTLIKIQETYSLDSYSLDAVAKDLLKIDGKIDLPPGLVFEKSMGSPSDLAEVVKYCCQDVRICTAICIDRSIILNLWQESAVFSTTMHDLATRALGAKIWSLVYPILYKENWVMSKNTHKQIYNKCSEKFEGAIVLDPVVGATDQPVAGLDFASLYPSIIRSYGLCRSSIVTDPRYMNLPGFKYLTCEWTEGDVLKKHVYVQMDNSKTVLPRLLAILAQNRKNIRKAMKTMEDPVEYAVNDAKQLQTKIAMNR